MTPSVLPRTGPESPSTSSSQQKQQLACLSRCQHPERILEADQGPRETAVTVPGAGRGFGHGHRLNLGRDELHTQLSGHTSPASVPWALLCQRGQGWEVAPSSTPLG